MKKALIILILIISIPILVVTLPWFAISIGIMFMPAPPPPKIQYGEFPFKLEYSIESQNFIIVDTVICKYEGVGSNESEGKYHKWETELASGKHNVVIYKLENDHKIVLNYGYASFYMDWLKPYVSYDITKPSFSYLKKGSKGLISQEELVKKYNIKIVNWEYTEPIVQPSTIRQ